MGADYGDVKIGGATLYHADCRAIIQSLTFDVLVTDPPYGLNLGSHDGAKDIKPGYLGKQGYESYDDTPEQFQRIVVSVVTLALDAAKRGCVFSAPPAMWDLPRPDVVGGFFNPGGCGRTKWGFTTIFHMLLYGSCPTIGKGARPTAWADSSISEKNGHPCPKPEQWMRKAVDLTSLPNETILDPFMGSGTTGVACANLGRKFIGIEIERKYFDIACERIDNAYRQSRMFA